MSQPQTLGRALHIIQCEPVVQRRLHCEVGAEARSCDAAAVMHLAGSHTCRGEGKQEVSEGKTGQVSPVNTISYTCFAVIKSASPFGFAWVDVTRVN